MRDELIQAEQKLMHLLGPKMSELQEILDDINDAPGQRRYQIELPDADTVDVPLETLASLVARSSNAYGRLARFAGKAKAEARLAKGAYERKVKQVRGEGSNADERAANAMASCEEEHLRMTVAQSIADLAESLEHAARIASESARKIYDKVVAMQVASDRESYGSYRDRDFQ